MLLLIIFIPLEMAFAQRHTPILRKNFHQDVIYHVANALLPPFIRAALLRVLVTMIRPLDATGVFSWVPSMPLLLRFALAVILGDIGSSRGHRWSHEIPLL